MSAALRHALARSPPPCGEGSGVGVTPHRCLACYPPPQPSPAIARGGSRAQRSRRDHALQLHRHHRRGRVGHGAGNRRGARRPRGHALRTRCSRMPRTSTRRVRTRGCPASSSPRTSPSQTTSRSLPRRHRPDRNTRAASARRRQRHRPSPARAHAGDRLRQGHRARHAQIHDRDHRGGRAACGAGDPVGPELCRRCRAGLADRGHARGKGRGACERTGAGAGLGDLPALSHHRCAWRRDRRRRQERAGDRGRHCGGPKARRLGAGRADHARLLRARAVRPRAWRAQRRPWSGSPASAT